MNARTNMSVLTDVIQKVNNGEPVSAEMAMQFVSAAGSWITEASKLMQRTIEVTSDPKRLNEGVELYALQLDIIKHMQTGGTYPDDMDVAG